MSDEQTMSVSEQKKEDWMNSKWRPAMGWMYMLVCTMDFVGFPVLWSLLQSMSHGAVNVQWQPLTLQGAGLFHIAMGAVLGLAAYGRTQEKLNGANNGGLALSSNVGTTYTPPTPVSGTGFSGVSSTTTPTASSGFGNTTTAPATSGFGGSSGFGAPEATNTVSTGFGGKKVVPEFSQPAI